MASVVSKLKRSFALRSQSGGRCSRCSLIAGMSVIANAFAGCAPARMFSMLAGLGPLCVMSGSQNCCLRNVKQIAVRFVYFGQNR